jgi:DNA-3-methyladenine glycosylase II
MKFSIQPQAPFDFDLTASIYSRFPVQCVDLYGDGLYERVLRIKNKNYLIRVNSEGSFEKPKILVEVTPDLKDKVLLKNKIKWLFSLDDNLEGFYQIAKKDKKFFAIIKSFYGLRVPKTPTVFEALIIAITEQQVAMTAALAMRRRLVERFGQSLKIGKKKYFAFPTPVVLAKAKPGEIRKLGLSLKKAEYIIEVAKKVVDEEIDLEAMKNWPMEKILATLTEIRGIGPWTVEYMMCRGMGRYEAMPADDLGLRSGLTQHLGQKERVSAEEARRFLDYFGQFKGYAAFYLTVYYAFSKYPRQKESA